MELFCHPWDIEQREVFPEKAHELGKLFADSVLKGKYKYIISTRIRLFVEIQNRQLINWQGRVLCAGDTRLASTEAKTSNLRCFLVPDLQSGAFAARLTAHR